MPSMMACKLDTTGLDKVEYREVEEAETEFSDPDNLTALIMSVGLNLDYNSNLIYSFSPSRPSDQQ